MENGIAMRAVTITMDEERPVLALAEVPEPKGADTDLIVRVAAIGVNRADLLMDRSHFGDNPLGIAGSELAGTVVDMGAACEGFKVGDRVMALAPACYADLAKVRYETAIAIPAGVSWRMAASLPSWYMTAHNALVTQGGLQPGQSVLVQGATSGVGTAALKLARYFQAGTIVGAARSQEKLLRLSHLIEGIAVVPLGPDWPEEVIAAIGGEADLIVDLIGGGVLDGNLDCVTIGGRIVAAGRLGGFSDVLNMNKLAFKQASITGVTFRSRTVAQRRQIARAFAVEVLPALTDGRIEPLLDRSFAFEEAAEAHAYVKANKHFGKVTIEVN